MMTRLIRSLCGLGAIRGTFDLVQPRRIDDMHVRKPHAQLAGVL